MPVLISAEELSAALDSPHPPIVLDVRWTLGGPPGHGEYLKGHIPGSVYVALDDELARHGEPSEGRHPLPDIDELQSAARRWGISAGDSVVVHDDAGNLAAARAWWLLRWAGLDDVRILDGALAAWRSAGLPLDVDDVTPEPGTIELAHDALPTLGLDDVLTFAESHVLLDARAGERFRGETEPIDPKAGHVPGAVSAPTGENLDADGRFLPADVLRERFVSLGVTAGAPVGTYCGSGVTAAHQLAALAIAGFDGVLFPGSWSQWSNNDLPVATGT
ncbi:sulfurtransferase [Aeromicrobium panaciterrae]|uniref:sulfurtransferase n=1 Tax=Aeromicrobium panaciterrae TaxID=363861 RepID=UPI0031D8C1F4